MIKIASFLLTILFLLTACQTEENNLNLRSNVDDFEKAFNEHKAEAAANYWLPDAVFSNPQANLTLKGKEEIQKKFDVFFKNNPHARLQIYFDKIEFVSENEVKALMIFDLTRLAKSPLKIVYQAYFVKRQNRWFIQKLVDLGQRTPPSKADNLIELDLFQQ